ncbi:lipopolysaccharide biosynthesis protein [Candidatus Saccharibacteria bacterium]|nr:lipopolysaccharide biosynthesis protein [Candidatus Saccharibacteria bacterium]
MESFGKRKIFSNMLWRFAERIGAQLVQFVVSIILARILAPEDYGTVALITVFITILQVFVDSGLGTALIQKKSADKIDFSTVFYTNVSFCVVLYLILFFTAPLIAGFYNNSSLVPLIRVLGITLIVSGLKSIQQAYVAKNMIFKKFFFSTLAGTIGAAAIGIYLALNGFGVWALVVQQVFNVTLDTVVLWMTVKWRPTMAFSLTRLKGLFSYGWKLLVSTLIDTVFNNARQLIIGKFYSGEDLAFYNRGKLFPNLIVANINTSMESVLLPSMSNAQDKREQVKKMTKQSIKVSVFVLAPLMVGMACISNNLVNFLLTDKWMPAVPYIWIFSVWFLLWPIHTVNLNAIKAMGRSDIFLKQEIFKKIAGAAIMVVTVWFGPLAMALGMLVEGIISQIINTWPNKKLLGYGYLEQIKDILPYIGLSVIMGGAVLVCNLFNLPVAVVLLIQVFIGAGIYLILARMFKLEALEYSLDLIKSMISKKRS